MLKKCKYVPVLETKRLIMREPVPDDAGDLKEWFGLEEVYQYWGNPPGKGEKNPEILFVDPRPNVKRKLHKGFICAVVEKESDKVIGSMEVFDIQNNRMGIVGYRIAPHVWGRGYCTEALKRIQTFIYTETKIDRLWTDIDVNNIASNRVVEKCGFTLEGTIRHGKFGSRYCDYNTWGFLREDYEKGKL